MERSPKQPGKISGNSNNEKRVSVVDGKVRYGWHAKPKQKSSGRNSLREDHQIVLEKIDIIETENTETENGVSADDVMFALDPEATQWGGYGFAYNGPWKIWSFLGCGPEDVTVNEKPKLTRIRLRFWGATLKGPIDWSQTDGSILGSLQSAFAFGKMNYPVNTMDVSSVTTAEKAFYHNEHFNHPLDSWDTSSFVSTDKMFARARSFDQSLASWDISRLRTAKYMFTDSGIGQKNLSDTLVGWAQTAKTKGALHGVDMFTLPHKIEQLTPEGQEAAQFLAQKFGWTF